jgi:hypothetical protein
MTIPIVSRQKYNFFPLPNLKPLPLIVMRSIKQAYFLFVAIVFCTGLFGQTDTLVAPAPATRGDMKARMASPKAAHGEVLKAKALPNHLGGGTTDIYKLVVEDLFRKKSHSFVPADFGAENLQLARWIDSRYFMFIATDFVDITGYHLYDTERDKVYECIYEVGEELGYLEIKPGQRFQPVIRDNEVSAWILEP